MNTDRSIHWLDIELDEPLSDANHQAFIEMLNDSVQQIVETEHSPAEAGATRAGIRIILPDTPGTEAVDRLSFICSGFKRYRIPMVVVVRENESFHEVAIPESALFNRLAKKFDDKFK